MRRVLDCVFFFFQAEDGIRDLTVTGVQTCALPISGRRRRPDRRRDAAVRTGGRGGIPRAMAPAQSARHDARPDGHAVPRGLRVLLQVAVRLDRRGDRLVRGRGPGRTAAAGARAGLPVRRRPRDAARRAGLAGRVAVLPHPCLPGVGRRAVPLHARPGAPGDLEMGAARRGRDPHVGRSDLRALSQLAMVHWPGQLHLGQPAAPRRTRDRARAPPGPCTVTHMIIESPPVQTPALLLHLDVVKRNVARMAERARRLGVRLRPHAKTHKCVELACLQLEHGAHGLTVATLVEARELARGGLTDLTWAFPLDPTHLPHVRRIVDETGATLRVVVDDLATARALAGSGLRVWLKVDCGYHRAGVDPVAPYAPEVGRELDRDAGALALSKDAGPGHVGPPAMGAVKGHPELSVATLSQEHGLIRAESRATIEGRFQVGERIEIIPNHSCLTVAHFDEYCVVEDGRVADRWRIARGR